MGSCLVFCGLRLSRHTRTAGRGEAVSRTTITTIRAMLVMDTTEGRWEENIDSLLTDNAFSYSHIYLLNLMVQVVL